MPVQIIENIYLSPRQRYARGEQMKVGLVPDDVLLVPRNAPTKGKIEEIGIDGVRVIEDDFFNDPDFRNRDTSSRMNVSTATFIDRDKKIRLKRPIVSSPMIDVTEADMAIALGKAGGGGVIHRGMLPERQANEIEKIKKSMGFIFERPPILPLTAKVQDARDEMKRTNRSLVVLTDEDNRVEGVVTRRDVKKGWINNDFTLADVINRKPNTQRRVITIIPEIDTSDPQNIFVRRREKGQKQKATDVMWKYGIEKLLIVDNEGRLVGALTDYDLRQYREFPDASIDRDGRIVVGAAVGIGEKMLERAETILQAGADFIVVDTANAYTEMALNAIRLLKKNFPNIPVIGGSNATRGGLRKLADSGVDGVRNHIGSGSICITRGVSGFGVPSLTSTLEVADEADKYGIPVIADGGVRSSSDIAKLLAAGARAVMLGRLLAATEESSAQKDINPVTGKRTVLYHGMATEWARQILEAAEGKPQTLYSRKAEGVPTKLRILGTVAYVVNDLIDGLRSGMTYGSVMNLDQLRDEVDFIRLTPAGQIESDVDQE